MADVTWKGTDPRHVCCISFWHKISYFRGNHRVRENFSYPLVPRTSTLLNLVVQNPRVLVQNVLSCSYAKWTSGAHKNKWNDPGMAKSKEIFPLILSSMKITLLTKVNFNSTVIWSQFSNVSVFCHPKWWLMISEWPLKNNSVQVGCDCTQYHPHHQDSVKLKDMQDAGQIMQVWGQSDCSEFEFLKTSL